MPLGLVPEATTPLPGVPGRMTVCGSGTRLVGGAGATLVGGALVVARLVVAGLVDTAAGLAGTGAAPSRRSTASPAATSATASSTAPTPWPARRRRARRRIAAGCGAVDRSATRRNSSAKRSSRSGLSVTQIDLLRLGQQRGQRGAAAGHAGLDRAFWHAERLGHLADR
jgi:hypothetical protein